MSISDVMIDAIEQVLHWDISDVDLGRAASSQAALMAKVHSDLVYSDCLDQTEQ